MDDATRPGDETAEELTAARAALSDLVDDLTHAVLTLFSSRGFTVGTRIAEAGGHPLEAVSVFVVTLHVLADGIADPFEDWFAD